MWSIIYTYFYQCGVYRGLGFLLEGRRRGRGGENETKALMKVVNVIVRDRGKGLSWSGVSDAGMGD